MLRTGYLERTGYLRAGGGGGGATGHLGMVFRVPKRTKNLGESRAPSFLSFSLEKGVSVKNLARD